MHFIDVRFKRIVLFVEDSGGQRYTYGVLTYCTTYFFFVQIGREIAHRSPTRNILWSARALPFIIFGFNHLFDHIVTVRSGRVEEKKRERH